MIARNVHSDLLPTIRRPAAIVLSADEKLRDALTVLFNLSGFKAEPVATLNALSGTAWRRRINVLLIEWQLGEDQTAESTIRELRAANADAAIYVFIRQEDLSLMKQIVSAGASGVHTVPYDAEELVNAARLQSGLGEHFIRAVEVVEPGLTAMEMYALKLMGEGLSDRDLGAGLGGISEEQAALIRERIREKIKAAMPEQPFEPPSA